MNAEVFLMNNKIQAKDLINLGLFTVLYFVIGCCVAIPIGFVPIFLPVLGALWALITGIPFMLFLTRVKKFGMVTIMGILSGLLMGLTGMGFWGVPLGAVFGLLGDLILKSGGYKSAKKSLLGYAVVQPLDGGYLYPHVLYGGRLLGEFCGQLRRGICGSGNGCHADVEHNPGNCRNLCVRHFRWTAGQGPLEKSTLPRRALRNEQRVIPP